MRQLSMKQQCRRQFMLGNKRNFNLTLLSVFINSAVGVSIAFIMQNVTEAMELQDFKRIRTAIILSVSTAGAALLMAILQKTFRNRYMKKGLSQFKKFIFEKLLEKSIGGFGDTSSGKFISAFSNDLASIESNYLSGNINIVTQVVTFIGGVVAMTFINWRLMLCVMATTTFPCIVALKYGNKITQKEKQTSAKNAGFVDQVKDLLNGFIVIKRFKAEKEVLSIFDRQNSELEEVKRKRRETGDMVSILSESSYMIVTIVLVSIGTLFVFKDMMTIGGVLAFVQLSNYVLNPIHKIVPLYSNRKAAISLIDKLAVTIETDDYCNNKIDIDRFDCVISYKNVSFAYEEEKTVLKNINIDFEKGKSYAIVGGSGGGKSTLLRLLLGHFNNYTGEILIDGKELRDISLGSLYDVVSVIQQNVFLFASSLKDNITMFKNFPVDKYENAVRLAGLTNLLKEKGNEYNCGEGGCNLSGGEKQRVSIARCLIRETPVLLMDEATAALDNETALSVSNAILDIDGLTRIIVTHKLEECIMKKYDEIIVVNNGTIVERGVFSDLMSKK
ncbi:MAG: ABC transporter ATP-binding protein, partial [Clostridiales bacterium]|nr:ABC transporter ATP-binding protein [Clostridiales bacterium]